MSACSRVFAILLLVVGVAVYFALGEIHFRVHSCVVYVPSRSAASVGIASSIFNFLKREGVVEAVMTVLRIIHLEAFTIFSPPPETQGKKLLMLGGSYIPEILGRAKQLGIELYLVDDIGVSMERRAMVHHFIPVANWSRLSIQEPQTILDAALAVGVKYDGVFTMVEDEGPLVSFIAEKLSFPASSVEAATTARNKFLAREAMKAAGLPHPRFAQIRNLGDLGPAAAATGFPAFLKPLFGVGAQHSTKATSEEELRTLYRLHQENIDPNDQAIYYFGSEMILEQQMVGPELQLELMLMGGEVVDYSLSSEYSPTRDWVCFPANRTVRHVNDIVNLASDTVKALGLKQGVVHLELFYTANGPQIIEVNNRMTRGFLERPSYQQLFGSGVDLYAAVLYLALNLPHPRSSRAVPAVPLFPMAVFPDGRSAVGWETEGLCAMFFARDSRGALEQGLAYRRRTPAPAHAAHTEM